MKSVLVIDDTKSNRVFMAKCLESEGYDVVTANNGKNGVELLKTKIFDFIILDMKMPTMSGMETLKWIKWNSINIPIVIVTAYGTVKNAIECMNNDVIAYIQKPFTINRFKKCILDIEEKIKLKSNNIREIIPDNITEFNSDTEFASAERMADDVILIQTEQIIKNNMVTNLFDMIPYSVLILNYERQIIYSNNYFIHLLGIKSDEELIGFRQGEILKCIHANEKISGCGTTECCSVCGAVKAILESQTKKTAVRRECLMTMESKNGVISVELLIHAAPAEIINKDYTILVIKDISNEKRREAIEKIFFHDILNTSGSIRGLVDCMKESSEIEETRELINCVSETTNIMIDEIKTQVDLIEAEKGELKLNLSKFSLTELILKLIKYNNTHIDYEIKLECTNDFIIKSDKILVLRVINNMIKNALEASENESINIGVEKKENFVEIYVNNKEYIPREIQLQIFKRSFSTKGKGRGLGTYSMKLIGEDYLKGYIRFISEKDKGTKFTFGLPYKAN